MICTNNHSSNGTDLQGFQILGGLALINSQLTYYLLLYMKTPNSSTRSTIILCAFLFFNWNLQINESQAQTSISDKLEGWGFKSGLNVTYITKASGDNPRKRFNLGVSYRVPLLSHLHFVPELLFQARGTEIEGSFQSPPIDWNILSLDTPALFRYTFARKHRWMVTSGPNVSYVFRSRISATQGNQSVSIGVSDVTKTVIFGWIGDVGYSIPAFNGAFVLGIRYNRGLGAQFKDSNGEKNDIFSVNIGFEF